MFKFLRKEEDLEIYSVYHQPRKYKYIIENLILEPLDWLGFYRYNRINQSQEPFARIIV